MVGGVGFPDTPAGFTAPAADDDVPCARWLSVEAGFEAWAAFVAMVGFVCNFSERGSARLRSPLDEGFAVSLGGGGGVIGCASTVATAGGSLGWVAIRSTRFGSGFLL